MGGWGFKFEIMFILDSELSCLMGLLDGVGGASLSSSAESLDL